MLSAPPATAILASPSMISCAAVTMACMPLPQSRLSVSAGTSFGMPAVSAATRARYRSFGSVWMTLPKTTWPTSAGSMAARLTASRVTIVASSVGGTSRKDPPKVPTAVRVPATITTSVDFDMSILRDWVNVGRGLAGGRCGSGEAPGQGQPFIQAVAGTVEIDAQGGHVLLELVDQSPRRFERILQGLGGSRLAGSSVAGF